MERPRFRTDLVTSPVEDSGQRFVDVTDPDSGTTFRFYEVEYAVATAMDGDRDVYGLIDWARAELGLQPTASEVSTVISTLADLGYLGGEAGEPAARGGAGNLDVTDLSLGAPGRSPIREQQGRRREASNIDLGSAGRMPRESEQHRPKMPTAPPLELGAAGFADPMAPPDGFGAALGPSADLVDPRRTLMGQGPAHLSPEPERFQPPPPMMGEQQRPPPHAPQGDSSDLSVDLGQHINIGTDDVKEAVRQSKVMSVVPAPGDFDAPTGSRPIELPGRPPSARPQSGDPMGRPQPAMPPPPLVSRPAAGPGLITIALGVVLLLAFGGAVYYFLFYAADDDSGKRRKPAKTPTSSVTNPDNPGSAGPTGMLSTGEKMDSTLTAPRAGKIVWLMAPDETVDKDAIVAKYAGFEKADDKLAKAIESQKRYQAKLDKATAAGDKAGMAAHETNVARKQVDVDAAQAELDAFFLKAPHRGTVSTSIELGDEVEAGASIVKVTSVLSPTVVFTITEKGKYSAGSDAEVASQEDPTLTAVCKVVSVDEKELKLECPDESGIKDGTAVVLH